MTERWHGSIVSIDCGDVLGIFEGQVSTVDPTSQTISLVNASRNTVKCQVPEVTLSARDIKNLKIIKSSELINKPLNVNSVIGQSDESAFVQPGGSNNGHICESPVQDENMKKKGEGKKKPTTSKRAENKKWMSERDEACFSAPVDSSVLETEFDFEKNLALFDKQAVYEEINALSKSDHNVRLVDCNKRSQPKYRYDENILIGDAPVMRQISVPCKVDKEYVTDSGLVVPSITQEFRELLFKKADEAGLAVELRLEMIGRAASEMVLQLLGGNHRLNPQNSHQRPTVVVLCGSHIQGAQGANCGRHLANHGVSVTVLSPPNMHSSNTWFARELTLFSLSGGRRTSDVSALPSTVDIIIGSLDGHDGKNAFDCSWFESTTQWATQCKAPVLCLDPPPEGSSMQQKWILAPALPFAFKGDKCSVYICDIGLPKGIFSELESSYTSPFGSKFIIPLYGKSD